jgi:uncharacterized protein (DUF427 family)
MKASVRGHVVAESNDIVVCDGYQYFPKSAVRMQWLESVPQTEKDKACPHVVQFYDVVIEGMRHSRAAWSYEAPRPSRIETAGRIGFWQDVEVG